MALTVRSTLYAVRDIYADAAFVPLSVLELGSVLFFIFLEGGFPLSHSLIVRVLEYEIFRL